MPPRPEKRGGAGFWILLCILCLGLGTGLGVAGVRYYSNGESPSPPQENSPPPEKPQTVAGLGRIEPKDGILSLGVPTPDRIASLKVKEGDPVKKDATVAVLDSAVLREQELERAKLQLEDARHRLEAIQASGEASIEVEKLHSQQVEQLEPIELKSLKARIKLLEQQRDQAKKDYGRYQNLRGDNIISDQDREKQRLALDQVEAELRAAELQRDKLATTSELNRKLAAAELRAAREKLKRGESEISLKLLQQQIDQAQQRVKDAHITAPSDGTILRVMLREGELVHGQPILQMANTGKMIVVAEIVDTDVQHVRVGQKAKISRLRMKFEGEEELTGRVTSIGLSVGRPHTFDVDPRAAMDNRIVEVKIELDQSKPVADLIGLQVKVTIDVGSDGASHY
jgi:ABC exporter DevB family membrane fusion protein